MPPRYRWQEAGLQELPDARQDGLRCPLASRNDLGCTVEPSQERHGPIQVRLDKHLGPGPGQPLGLHVCHHHPQAATQG